MHFFSKIVSCEKFARHCLGILSLLGGFGRLLCNVHWLFITNFLLFSIAVSCSTKSVISGLKDLQPHNNTKPTNIITKDQNISYPISSEQDLIFEDNHSIETFIILIIAIIIFCFLNSEYPSKIISIFKKKNI